MSQSPPASGSLVKPSRNWPVMLYYMTKSGWVCCGMWDRDVPGIMLGYRADPHEEMDLVLYKGRQLWCDTDRLVEVTDGSEA